MLDSTDTDRTDAQGELDTDAASTPFLGQWNRLISTTNWEKGRIIYEWRESLFLNGASPQDYSDEAWSRLVGHVTGQHVGRLRRVFERYGQTRETYPGLYWSHFQATLDWHDAEMWLEGAVQNGWSVAQMRQQRWEATGSQPDQRPRDEDIIVSELDEDAAWDQSAKERESGVTERVRDPLEDKGGAHSASYAETDFGDESAAGVDRSAASPFADVGELPDDLADAVEAMKLSIVRHKLAGWTEVTCEAVIAALEALKLVATNESDGN